VRKKASGKKSSKKKKSIRQKEVQKGERANAGTSGTKRSTIQREKGETKNGGVGKWNKIKKKGIVEGEKGG